MEDFTHSTLLTKPHDLNYSYYTSPSFSQDAAERSKPVLVLVHGFPDDAWMWAGAIPHLQKELSLPILAVDLLGFGRSSKPTDPLFYNYRKQADCIAQILDHEGVKGKRIIPIGHDWGSATSQRFYLYHRHRCIGLVLISLAYQVPTPEPFDLNKANKVTAKRFGYPQWEYFNFFIAPDAPRLMRDNMERFYDCNHGLFRSSQPGEEGRDIWMREIFCTPNAMRDYVQSTGKYADFSVELKPYAKSAAMKKQCVDRLRRDGMEGPVCYYTSLTNNTMLEDERELCQTANRKLDCPVLYIGQDGDWVCRTDLMSDAKEQGLAPDIEEKAMEAGHWVLYEKPEEVATLVIDWVRRRFQSSS